MSEEKIIAKYGILTLGGVAIFDCNDEQVVYKEYPRGQKRHSKVYYNAFGRPYFLCNGCNGRYRIYLDECESIPGL